MQRKMWARTRSARWWWMGRTSRSEKAATKNLPDGTVVHSFRTALAGLSTIVRNTCRTPGMPNASTFPLVTIPTLEQQRALDLLAQIAA